MAIQNNSSLLVLNLPPKTQERVSNLATGLIAAIKDETSISPDSLLGFLTNLIRGEKPSEASTNTQGWLELLQNTTNQKKKDQIASNFILEYAPEYFTEDPNKYKKDEYLERFLPKELTNKDFKYLQHLASIMNPPVNLKDTPENRKSILDETKANLKATLVEWFDYLNNKNGGLAYLGNKTRHWIFHSVANLELRILDDKPNPKTLEKILKNPEAINSHKEIDATAFAKFKNILEKYQSGSLNQEEIKNEISKDTAREPNLDFDYRDKLSKLFSNNEIDKVTLYSLILNDPRGTKVNFQNRTENSIKDFPVLNPALIGEINDIVKFCETQPAQDIKARIQEKYAVENSDIAQFLVDNIQINREHATSSLNFAALYAFLQNQSQKEIDLTTTDGEWRKFPKGSDANELRDSIKGFNTGWCIQGLETAQGYLNRGDFYMYYSKDPNGKATIPRLAIAMRGDQIIEVRGIAAKQNLDPYIANVINENGQTILAEKLYSQNDQGKAVFPNSEQWLRADQDMKDLSILHAKFKNNQEFTDKDLFFIYEITRNIQSFNMTKDPRINEILKTRDRTEDFKRIFGDEGYAELLGYKKEEYYPMRLSLFQSAVLDHRNKSVVILNAAEKILSPEELKAFLFHASQDGDNALILAVENNNKELLELILNTAARNLSPEELKTLLSQASQDGNNVLMGAAKSGNKETAALILGAAEKILNSEELKTFLSQASQDGNNVLMGAAKSGNKETAALILGAAEKILNSEELKKFLSPASKDGNNALTWAAGSGNKETAALILNAAEKILNSEELKKFLSQAMEDGRNALKSAVMNGGNKETAALILNAAEKILNHEELKKFLSQASKDGRNALILAAETHDEEKVALILNAAEKILNHEELKIFLSQTSKDGRNALKSAEGSRNKETVALILNAAENILNPEELKKFLSQSDKQGNNAFMWSRWRSNKEPLALILNAAENILNPEELKKFLSQANKDGNNALMLEAGGHNKEVVALILNAAENILNPQELTKFLSKTDKNGNNALMLAQQKNDPEFMKLIEKALQKVN
jgi:DNA-binding phage protein